MLVMGGLVGLLIAGLFLDFGNVALDRDEEDPEGDPPEDPSDPRGPVIAPDPGHDGGDPADGPGGRSDADPDSHIADSLSGVTGQWGSAGAGDILMGGAGGDVIRGGHGGNDLRGGLGDDTIHGGDGGDWIQGDGAYGAGGDDVIYGGAGADLLCGQGGDDLIYGGDGDDTILGGEGNDTLFGGAGNDWLSGGDGDDLLISTAGSDDLDGGRGNDVLIGHDGPETVWMNGGEGDDTLMPGAHDFASGNAGADTFILRSIPEGFPTIADFDASEDQIHLHLDEEIAATAEITLHEDLDGTWLLEVNGHAVGRLLHHGGLQPEDVRIVAIRA